MSRFVKLFIIVMGIGVATTKPAFPQSFTPLYPPNSEQSLVAYCYDQYGFIVPNCDVTIYTGVFLYTNGHFHDSIGHPFGSAFPAAGNTGCCGLAVVLTTTIVGQAEGIGACATYCSELDYGVGYLLYFVDENALWSLRGATANHGSNLYNHWATAEMSTGIYNTASQFSQAHPEVGRIGLNDMALVYGGKFDINSDWMSPHIDHDLGRAVDINLVPQELAVEFKDTCLLQGASFAQVEYTPYHIHCRW